MNTHFTINQSINQPITHCGIRKAPLYTKRAIINNKCSQVTQSWAVYWIFSCQRYNVTQCKVYSKQLDQRNEHNYDGEFRWWTSLTLWTQNLTRNGRDTIISTRSVFNNILRDLKHRENERDIHTDTHETEHYLHPTGLSNAITY